MKVDFTDEERRLLLESLSCKKKELSRDYPDSSWSVKKQAKINNLQSKLQK